MFGLGQPGIPFVVGLVIVGLEFDEGADGASGDGYGLEGGKGFLRGAAGIFLMGFEDFDDLGAHELDLEFDFLAGVVAEHVALFCGVIGPVDAGGWVVFRFGWMAGRVDDGCSHHVLLCPGTHMPG